MVETFMQQPLFDKLYSKRQAFISIACMNSKVYSGYAFGMGVERITNLKYKVKDLRMFSENDTRFLEEFESAN